VNLSDFEGYPHHSKVWGTEIWLINSPLYCAKLLILAPAMQCSLHRHLKKTETFFILQGIARIEVGSGKNYEYKTTGDSVHLPAGTWHRFADANPSDLGEDCIILEVSSHHDDEDVERLEPSGRV
jgi:mannose-6-phosphate isomerase-like protein (cupin superfamily)